MTGLSDDAEMVGVGKSSNLAIVEAPCFRVRQVSPCR